MAVYNETSQGGLRCSGSAVVPPVFWIGDSTERELQAYEKFLQEWNNVDAAPSSGTRSIFKALATYGEDSTGGIEAGGASVDRIIYNVDGSGGVEGGGIGDIPETFSDVGSGGAEGGGRASFTFGEDGAGGIEAGGQAIPAYGQVGQGGAETGGEAVDGLINVAQGGAEVGGQSVDSVVANEFGSGGVRVGSNKSINNLAVNKYYNITDPSKLRLVVGGEAATKLDLKYIASGGVSLGSKTDVNFKFSNDLTLRWRLNALIVKDTTFLWNTGELPIVWYRVIGKQSEKCEPLQDCCQKMITNIHARTPAELCEKLRERRFQFRIDSVQKFTRPAENNNVTLDDDCNELVPVEICEVPACAEFCVDFEPQVFLGIRVTAQVDAFFTYESTGQVYVGGSAGIDYERYIPDFPYEASGGLTLGGTVDYISSGYGPVVDGGISIGGTAKQKSSHWDYIGGEWPLLTGDLAPTQSESLDELITDVPWGAIDRVLNDDPLPTQTDLSFGKTSEYLIVRGFDINIPEDAEIMGVVVKVKRSSSNIGVVDDGVYLLVGDEIISDNLANAPDWPLIATEWWYGNTGGEQDTGLPWVSEDSDLPPLSAEDLTDPDFGFAIRIKSRTTLDAIFAFITYIDLAIYYEDAGDVHILRTGGEADVRSTAYSYQFSDGLEIGGTAGLRVGRRYLTTGVSPTLTSAFSTGGSYGLHYKYESDVGVLTDRIKRGVECGGSALVTPYIYNEIPLDADGVSLGGSATVSTAVALGTGARLGGSAHLNPLPVTASGGASMGGAAKVTPYHEVASGGVVIDYKTPEELKIGGEADCRPSWQLVEASGGASMGGTAKITPYLEEGTGGASAGGVAGGNHTNNYSYEATGGFTLGGISSPFEAELEYETSGGVELGGEADYKSSAYHFTSDGAAIFVLGGASVQGSDLGVQQTNAGADFRILELQFDYGEETPEEIEIPTGTVTRCACPEMSFFTEVSHNMVRDNRFAQFLVRNNFTISRILTMKYNVPNDSWQTNLHYRGVSAKNNNLEDWNVVLELRCTSNSGGIDIGESIWQFSVQVSVEDLITGEDFDTRILVGLIPDQLCSAGDLSFSIDYDTDLDFVSVNPNAVVYNNILYDNIGLFKNRAWKQSPILSFEVSQSGIDALTPRYDASGFGENRPLRPV